MRPLIMAMVLASGVALAAPPVITCTATVVGGEPRLGGWPMIRLEFANPSSTAVRVLDIWGKPEWWCPSSQVVVTRDGKPFMPGRVICDPPPPDEDLFVSLVPGARKAFQFNPFHEAGSSLPEGTYALRVSWFYADGAKAVSAPITFQVSR